MNTIPAPIQSDEIQLRDLAQAIEGYRLEENLSKKKLLQLYPDLGSDKTLNSILADSMSELDVNRWLLQYRHVWSEIQAGDDSVQPTTLCDKLTGPSELCRAVREVAKERGNARVIFLIGPSGVGKTSSIEVLKSKPYGWRVLEVQASDLWRGRQGTGKPLLKAIAKALGMTKLPPAKDDLLEEVIAKLSTSRRILVIDEMHHLDPSGLNTVKTLVNTTPGEFILSGLRTAWQRICSSREAYEECKQLTGNRLAECIELHLSQSDVETYIGEQLATLPGYNAELGKRIAAELASHASLWGNYSFLRDVCARITRAVIKSNQSIANITVTTALNAELKSRGGQAAKSVRVIARENAKSDSDEV